MSVASLAWIAFAAALAGGAVFLVVGCNPPAEIVPDNAWRVHRPGAKALVAVYSRSGHTARAARGVADELGADYVRLRGRGGEGDSFFRTPSSTRRVAVEPGQVDLAAYQLVVIASPIWYWRPTALALSFVEANDFAGKDVVLLYTNEGGLWRSGLEGWKARVERRGGRVVGVLGIDRKELPRGETVEARAVALLRGLDLHAR